eukprot:gene15775-21898_t
MGVSYSCTSYGAVLLLAAANGELSVAQELLKKHPRASLYHNCKEKSSPLIQAAARGHFELLQLILETAVMVDGPERAKKDCIDHSNQKKQTALMVACKHGHADSVEYLVTNGAEPLMWDERRHNSCLHFAALYGHSECVHKLLGSRAGDEDDTVYVKFIDRHNGWGLTALHIAVFQGSVDTVRALLRHGANLESVIISSKVENSPIRCAVGSNALHIAALIGNIVMAKLILEAQESHSGLELRSKVDAVGLRPQEYAQQARNPVLVHLLDERLPVTLLRQIWMNYSLEQSMPPRHQTLNSLLQKLKLVFNLELIAIERNMALQNAAEEGGAGGEDAGTQISDIVDTAAVSRVNMPPGLAYSMTSTRNCIKSVRASDAAVRLPWNRQTDVKLLLHSVTSLHANLELICRQDNVEGGANGARSSTHEAVLDFILSTLITPRTVSAILHAAKKLVCSSLMQEAPPAGTAASFEYPPDDSEAQHGLALLTTALRAVETCLHAATHLTNPVPSAEEAAGASVSSSSFTAAAVTTAASLASATAHSLFDDSSATVLATPPLRRVSSLAEMSTTGSTTTTTLTSLHPRLPAPRNTPTPTPSAANHHPLASHTPAVDVAPSGNPYSHVSSILGLRMLPGNTPLLIGGATPPGLLVLHNTRMPGLPPPPPAGAGACSPHWSSHLHMLIAQLQRLANASSTSTTDPAAIGLEIAPPSPSQLAPPGTPAAASPEIRDGADDPDDNDTQGDGDFFNANEIATGRAGTPSCTGTKKALALVPTPKHSKLDGMSLDDNASEVEGTSVWSEDDRSVCSICMDLPVAVLIAGCHHGLCVHCAFQLTIKGRELPCCPFCRQKIVCFEAKQAESSSLGRAVEISGGKV